MHSHDFVGRVESGLLERFLNAFPWVNVPAIWLPRGSGGRDRKKGHPEHAQPSPPPAVGRIPTMAPERRPPARHPSPSTATNDGSETVAPPVVRRHWGQCEDAPPGTWS